MPPGRPQRLAEIPGFGIDRVAAAAAGDPDILRLENLDTDIAPPAAAVDATRVAAGRADANSWLPFTGKDALKAEVAAHLRRRSGVVHDPAAITITCGEGDSMLDALLATVDAGDEVVLTDPCYAGMVNRVRLTGAVPRLVPMVVRDGSWRLDLEALAAAAASPRVRAIFIMSPSFPTGQRLDDSEWAAVCDACRSHDLWLLYWQQMEGIVFDGAPVVHPAAFEGMAERTISIGGMACEWRMIGWRIGWLAPPAPIAGDLGMVHIYNGLVAGGIAQAGALAALREGEEPLRAPVAEWQRRRDLVMEQLDGLPAIRGDGGWSLLLDTAAMDIDPADASRRLLEHKVAATPMTGWGGDVAARHVRIVFSAEPQERLRLLGERARRALT